MRSNESLSVVIPAYNEAGRIGATVRRLGEYLRERAWDYELIVVDDGSCDGTVDIVRNASEEAGRTRLLQNEGNRGKGFSVRKGVAHAARALILVTDADLSTPIEEIEKLLPWLGRGYDLAIGSRGLLESDVLKKQAWYRQGMGKVFNLLVRILVLRGFADTQCGFKLFRGEAGRRIFEASKIDRFAFDVEAILLAEKMGYRVREVPVRWINAPLSRVRITADSTQMLLDLFLLRLRMGRMPRRQASGDSCPR